jgi:hypothetical protein
VGAIRFAASAIRPTLHSPIGALRKGIHYRTYVTTITAQSTLQSGPRCLRLSSPLRSSVS